MKKTIILEEETHKKLKMLCVQESKTFNNIIQHLIKNYEAKKR